MSNDCSTILSFDVEEHYRIEAAADYDCPAALRLEYADRMETSTRQLLDLLGNCGAKATFFIVGKIAAERPKLIREIRAGNHEIACHSWDHQRVHHFTPATFAEDLKKGKDALEQASGAAVRGYRAPTFSIVRQTAWAIDVIADAGFAYDSSIFPVRHDRYGVHDAPRMPFMAIGATNRIVELPLLTLRLLKFNLPVAGGGYFRLLPLSFLEAGLHQIRKRSPSAAMVYFHPWEFDVEQPQLPLSRLSRFRTYVGIRRSTEKLKKLLLRHRFRRAIDVVEDLKGATLPEYAMLP